MFKMLDITTGTCFHDILTQNKVKEVIVHLEQALKLSFGGS